LTHGLPFLKPKFPGDFLIISAGFVILPGTLLKPFAGRLPARDTDRIKEYGREPETVINEHED